MSDIHRKSSESENTAEILTGRTAAAALQNTNVLRELIHHHADFNFAPAVIDQAMSRDQVAHILGLYNYPPGILTEQQVATRIEGMAEGFRDRTKEACAQPVYDVARFEAAVEGHRAWFEQNSLEQVGRLGEGGDMLVARVDGKVAGMLGMRKLPGLFEGRQLYEHLKASVLPQYEKRGIFAQLKKQAVEMNCEESGDPLWLVHSKNPIVLKKTEKYHRRKITFEDYGTLRGWNMSEPYVKQLKEQWEIEGWEYWIVDFLKAAETSHT